MDEAGNWTTVGLALLADWERSLASQWSGTVDGHSGALFLNSDDLGSSNKTEEEEEDEDLGEGATATANLFLPNEADFNPPFR